MTGRRTTSSDSIDSIDRSEMVQRLRALEVAAYGAWLHCGPENGTRLYGEWLRALRAWLDERDARSAPGRRS